MKESYLRSFIQSTTQNNIAINHQLGKIVKNNRGSVFRTEKNEKEKNNVTSRATGLKSNLTSSSLSRSSSKSYLTSSSLSRSSSSLSPNAYIVNDVSLNENNKDLLLLIEDSHGLYHLMKFSRSIFLEENVKFLKETSRNEIDKHVDLEITKRKLGKNREKIEKIDSNNDILRYPPINTAIENNTIIKNVNGSGSDGDEEQSENEWLNYILKVYIESGSTMEINVSSNLRKRMLLEIHNVITNHALDEKKTHPIEEEEKEEEEKKEEKKEDDDVEDGNVDMEKRVEEEKERIYTILQPARKEVMKMLTSGDGNCLDMFRKTPMYQVCIEWRTRKQKSSETQMF